MDINKDKIKVKKKTANAKKNNRSVSEAKKSGTRTHFLFWSLWH